MRAALLLVALLHLSLAALTRSQLLLRCCVVTERPFIYLDPDGRYAGATVEYYNSLRSTVPGGFKCVKSTGVDGDESFVAFAGFSELVEHFDTCAPGVTGTPNNDTSACDCDIGTISAARNSDRNGKVDFVAPMFFDSLAVVERTSLLRKGGNTLFFLRPFSTAVWCGLAGLLFLHVFVTLFDRNFSPAASGDAPPDNMRGLARARHFLLKTKLLRRMRFAFFATAFGMVGHSNESAEPHAKVRPTTRQRFMALLAITLGTFLLLVYESGLVLQLFLGEPVSEFRDINDMKDCKINSARVCVPAGGNDAQFWNASIFPARKSAKCDKLYPTWTYPDGDEDAYRTGLMRVAEERDECSFLLASKTTVETASHTKYCGELSLVGKDFSPNALSYVLPLGSPHTAALSDATLELQRRDKIKDATDFAITSRCVLRTEAQLTWLQLGVFFYVAYGFLGLMMVVMCFGSLLRVKSKRVRDKENAVVDSSAEELEDRDDAGGSYRNFKSAMRERGLWKQKQGEEDGGAAEDAEEGEDEDIEEGIKSVPMERSRSGNDQITREASALTSDPGSAPLTDSNSYPL